VVHAAIKKQEMLQDFLFARRSSSEDLHSKFGVYPFLPNSKTKIPPLILKDGVFYYTSLDIEAMLKVFQEAANPFCGKKPEFKRMV
jgi:hypothetical protein